MYPKLPPVNRTKFYLLRQLIKSIYTIDGRQSIPTNPIRNPLLLKLIKFYNKQNLEHTTIRAFFTFAKFFLLRIGEYAIYGNRINQYTLYWKHIRLFCYHNKWCAQLTLTIGKTNRNNKREILTIMCSCSYLDKRICAVHCLLELKNMRSNTNSFNFLFTNINGKPINTIYVTKILNKALINCGITLSPQWRPHSFRHGGTTDLMAANVPKWIIEKLARWAPNSRMVYYYTSLTSTEECLKAFQCLEKYFKS